MKPYIYNKNIGESEDSVRVSRTDNTCKEFSAREELQLNLRHYAEAHGYTQTDLCLKTGIAKSTMSSYFSGERYPRAEQLDSLARCFGISVGQLTGNRNSVDDEEYVRDLPFELRVIAREGRKLSPQQRVELLRYCTFVFPEVFGSEE